MVMLVKPVADKVEVKNNTPVCLSGLLAIDPEALHKAREEFKKEEDADPLKDPILLLRETFKSKLNIAVPDDEPDDDFLKRVSHLRFRLSDDVRGVFIYREMKSGRLAIIPPSHFKKVEAVALTKKKEEPFDAEVKAAFVSPSMYSERRK